MILPFKTDVNTYRTILKVEIVLEPKVDNFEDIPEPSIIQVFTLDKYSRITGILTDLSGNPVYGYPEINPNYKEDRKYRIDITDYYNSIVSGVSGGIDPELYLLVGLQGTPVQVGTREIKTFVGTNNLSFQRRSPHSTNLLRKLLVKICRYNNEYEKNIYKYSNIIFNPRNNRTKQYGNPVFKIRYRIITG